MIGVVFDMRPEYLLSIAKEVTPIDVTPMPGSVGREGVRPFPLRTRPQTNHGSNHVAERRVVRVERRIVAGTAARVEKLRRHSQGGPGVLNTAYIAVRPVGRKEALASG